MMHEQLITFSQDLLPVLDKVVNNYAAADFQERLYECEGNRDIWVRTFNLLLVPDAHHGFVNPSTTTPLTSNKSAPRTKEVEST